MAVIIINYQLSIINLRTGTMKNFGISWFRRIGSLTVFCLAGLFVLDIPAFCEAQRRSRPGGSKVIQLPAPNLSGAVSVEEAIVMRRSVRQFADKPLNFVQMGQLAWAGQGITDKQRGLRAAPSAGALYPIDLFFVTPDGLFVYRPEGHSLEQLSQSDLRKQLSSAALGQGPVEDAACDIVIAGSVRKLATKYGNKATKFMLLEAGHVAENIQLQAVALGLVSLPVGAFDVKNIAKTCELSGDLEPLLIVCVGYPLVKQEPDKSQPGDKTTTKAKRAVLVVPSVNFADEELFETRRVLTEASIETVIASSKIGPLQGTLGGITASEVVLDKVRVEDFDAVVFIGGPGAEEYFTNPAALGIVRESAARGKVIAAISIAPTILANAGVLRGVRATGFLPQREQMQRGGAQYTGAPVERDGLIITGSDPSAAIPFAQTVAAALQEGRPTPGKNP
jgi:SagB-type dehydrogenase family enzyme